MKRLVPFALALLLAGCGSGSAVQKSAQQDQRVTVFAAASLSKAFAAEAKAYESRHPGTDVVLSFAGSQALVAQVQQGAPADVLATADAETIAKVQDRLRGAPRVLAHNQLAVVTAEGNPRGIRSLADLGRPGLRVVLAGPTVPVGKAAAKALKAAGVTVRPVSLEDAVTGVVTKVRLGEADAGIAYVTDLTGGVAGVPVPGTTTTLEIGALRAGAATGFVEFVLSPEGQAVLRRFGFS